MIPRQHESWAGSDNAQGRLRRQHGAGSLVIHLACLFFYDLLGDWRHLAAMEPLLNPRNSLMDSFYCRAGKVTSSWWCVQFSGTECYFMSQGSWGVLNTHWPLSQIFGKLRLKKSTDWCEVTQLVWRNQETNRGSLAKGQFYGTVDHFELRIIEWPCRDLWPRYKCR